MDLCYTKYFIVGKDCTGSCICDVRYRRGYFKHACAHGAWPVHYIGWCGSREALLTTGLPIDS